LSIAPIHAQNSPQTNLEKLCSAEMHGRGYVKKGDCKAAKYITEQYKVIGLEPVGKSYLQKFKLGVNTFPKKMQLILDEDTLIAGVDFIINAKSPKIKGSYNILNFDVEKLADQNYLNTIFNPDLPEKTIFKLVQPQTTNRDTLGLYYGLVKELQEIRPVLLFTDAKFTWSVGRSVQKNAVFEVKTKYSKAKKATLNVNQKFIKNYKTQNVLGFLPAKVKTEETMVICGHYDHLGRMGMDAYFPGANDNASGITMILKLAQHFKEHPTDKNLLFISFGGEEAGLVGSQYFAENPTFPLEKIDFVLNIDIMGSGDEGITMVNANDQKDAFDKMTNLNHDHEHIKTIKKRGQTKNSDHYPFSNKGVPAVFIYTQGNNSNYHDVFDTADHVSFESFNKVYNLFVDFISTYP
jgi:hypothetical protein